MKASERRDQIHQILEDAQEPITASELAREFNVSRQVIVGDVALLRARNILIIATNAGYLIPKRQGADGTQVYRGKIACQHQMDQTRQELELIIDLGGQVEDVEVDHPVFGVITAPLTIRHHDDIDQFISLLAEYQADMLSSITDGVHVHTITTPDRDTFLAIKEGLDDAGILLREED